MDHAPRPKRESAIHPNGWMLSYADMATILLAMFIVLSTLGKDQTGIRLAAGTGSYRETRDRFGLPGSLSGSSQAMPLPFAGPQYLYKGPDDPSGKGTSVENQGVESGRVLDGEQAQFQHFLRELERQLPVEKMPRVIGHVAVDCYDPFQKTGPLLGERHFQLIGQVLPLLRRPQYRIYLVVWATTPSESAWMRALTQARQVVEEVASAARLDAARERLLPLAKPWRHANLERPVFSLLITKAE